MKYTWAWMLACLMLLPAGCRQEASSAGAGPKVRVRLIANVDRVMVSATQPPTLTSSKNSQSSRLNFPSVPVPLVIVADGWRIGDVPLSSGELTLDPATHGSVSIDGKAYRGRYRFVPTTPGKFDVINDVEIDAYLKGVLSAEMPSKFHPEAFKAQAIAARTYALYEVGVGGRTRHYDVEDTVASQVYKGIAGETSKSVEGSDSTSGIVVAYGGKGNERIFKAYFSACCGGIGQSSTDAFKDVAMVPLTEQNVGAQCNISPRFNWPPVVLSKIELTRRIRAYGQRRNIPIQNMAALDRIDIAATNRFGRPIRFIITDTRGTRYALESEATRWACNAEANGGPILWSSFFKPVSETDQIRFVEGKGFGHGVGLCQWCAEAQGQQGVRAEDIVLKAYPGARLVRAY